MMSASTNDCGGQSRFAGSFRAPRRDPRVAAATRRGFEALELARRSHLQPSRQPILAPRSDTRSLSIALVSGCNNSNRGAAHGAGYRSDARETLASSRHQGGAVSGSGAACFAVETFDPYSGGGSQNDRRGSVPAIIVKT